MKRGVASPACTLGGIVLQCGVRCVDAALPMPRLRRRDWQHGQATSNFHPNKISVRHHNSQPEFFAPSRTHGRPLLCPLTRASIVKSRTHAMAASATSLSAVRQSLADLITKKGCAPIMVRCVVVLLFRISRHSSMTGRALHLQTCVACKWHFLGPGWLWRVHRRHHALLSRKR